MKIIAINRLIKGPLPVFEEWVGVEIEILGKRQTIHYCRQEVGGHWSYFDDGRKFSDHNWDYVNTKLLKDVSEKFT